jgi:succinate dehydrogenase / fumarate reductase iron-sulfur subunit
LSEQFRCPCHGGNFDRQGNVLAGPPPRPLDRYAFKVDSGHLLVEVT